MAQTTTATTNFDKTVQVLIRKELEEELLPNLPHLSAVMGYLKATFLKGSNSTMRFLRIPYATPSDNGGTVTPGTAPWLTQGVAPTAKALSIGYEEFTAFQAGQRWELTDVALMESPIDLMSATAKVCARDAAETADLYVGRKLAAGTNALFAGHTSVATVAAGDLVTGALLRRASAGLDADSVPRFGDGSFHAIVHPGVVFDIESDDDLGGWLDIARYAGGDAIRSGEVGMYAGIKFFRSPRAFVHVSAGAASADVYNTIVAGPGAYAFGDWGSVTSHYSPMQAAPGNELAQVASIGWKGFLGAMLIDEAGSRYVNIKSASGL